MNQEVEVRIPVGAHAQVADPIRGGGRVGAGQGAANQ